MLGDPSKLHKVSDCHKHRCFLMSWKKGVCFHLSLLRVVPAAPRHKTEAPTWRHTKLDNATR